MPAVLPFASRGTAEFCLIEVAPPGRARTPIGIILVDSTSGRTECRFRTFDGLDLSEDDEVYLEAVADETARSLRDHGVAYLSALEDSASNFLVLTQREAVSFSSFDRALNTLFEEHVDTKIHKFVTHLPVYSLRAAATRFGEEMEVEETGWRRAPERLRVTEDLFIAQVTGRSMQPLIPDGSFCIFRKLAAGSRQGKRLLIQQLGSASAEFTVKRYTSVKQRTGDEDDWSHQSIRLEPLNPEFEAFDLTPDEFNQKYRAIAEFVQVLEP